MIKKIAKDAWGFMYIWTRIRQHQTVGTRRMKMTIYEGKATRERDRQTETDIETDTET